MGVELLYTVNENCNMILLILMTIIIELPQYYTPPQHKQEKHQIFKQ